MLDKLFNFLISVMCFCCILLVPLMILTDLGGRNYSHPVITAILLFVVSMFIFRRISPIASVVVCIVAYIVVTGMNGGLEVSDELMTDLSPLISAGIGFALLYGLFLRPRSGGSDSSSGSSQKSGRQESRRNSDYDAERQRDKQKAWGQPVGSGSCPYLLRIESGYYESWNVNGRKPAYWYRYGRNDKIQRDAFVNASPWIHYFGYYHHIIVRLAMLSGAL